ncbi:hypothetical protein JTE90_014964 [Oedothorax gibbosus]|uniref:Uncharacterized protein n=1 Tax=Oedothorax gibbosus TaxID=931172 RepID=A0AAV6V075_9ARAC|nr:hypothetical protein JTE90_014964 [Oedothorax gibbosus]
MNQVQIGLWSVPRNRAEMRELDTRKNSFGVGRLMPGPQLGVIATVIAFGRERMSLILCSGTDARAFLVGRAVGCQECRRHLPKQIASCGILPGSPFADIRSAGRM